MPKTKDYYDILGLSRGASQKEVQSAFRKLARKHHPDVNQGDKAAERRFKEISEAHEVLADPEKRKAYDRFGPEWQAAQAAAGAGPGFPGGGGSRVRHTTVDQRDLEDLFGNGNGFGDVLGSIFGGRRAAGRPAEASATWIAARRPKRAACSGASGRLPPAMPR